MLGTTFLAVFGRTFTGLISKLTAVVAELLFLYHFFMISDCFDSHTFRGSMIVQSIVHAFCFEAVFLVMLFCQESVSLLSMFLLLLSNCPLWLLRPSFKRSFVVNGFLSTNLFKLSTKSLSAHCSHSSPFFAMISLTGPSLSKSV